MSKLKLETEEIKRKKELLKKAETVLKEEFVGIDDVIEQTLINMRPWYLYPELQEKPLVISLIGLTGTGKTSLVKRISELLEIESDMVYFNFAEINEMKSWEIEENIEENLANERSNRMFVYDEFQYAATLSSDGEEKDNRSGLKPFWELMDSGIIHKGCSFYDSMQFRKILYYMERLCENERVKLKDGVWVNSEACLVGMEQYDINVFKGLFNIPTERSEDKISQVKECVHSEVYDEDVDKPITPCSNEPCIGNAIDLESEQTVTGMQPPFFKESIINRLYSNYHRLNPEVDEIDFFHKVTKMCFDELYDFVSDVRDMTLKGYDLKFNDSIIFVLANLDEAYTMSFDVDPDMDPDQFNKITKKLTIVDIKAALRRRFRNEQIARLGNIFMIYPSFSSESFRKMIDLFLNHYAKSVEDKWGVKFEFDESIKEIIYKDSVFPTHGTRPIMSSIHEIVKTKFPAIVDKLSADNITEADTFCMSYKNEKVFVNVLNNEQPVANYDIEQKLRVENNRFNDNPEQQASVAVHESGHFVIYTSLMDKVPEKVCSSTVSKDAEGFVMEDADDFAIYSKEELMNKIKIALGGYVAEELVFGTKRRSAGASSDLEKATAIASSMVRKYGMGSGHYVTTYLNGDLTTRSGMLIKDDKIDKTNSEIKKILDGCLNTVRTTLETDGWKKMFKDSAMYLSEHTTLPKDKMEELYAAVPENLKNHIDENFYRNALKNF